MGIPREEAQFFAPPPSPLEMRSSLVALVGVVAYAQAMGGYTEITDIGPASKVHQLASFSLQGLQAKCAGSNHLVCGHLAGTRLIKVLSASSQVVSGMNFKMVCETAAGTLTLEVYEQGWTNTLVLRSASLTAPVGGASFGLVELGDAIDPAEPLALDDKAFRASLYAEASECTGGMQWNECTSPCTKTCEDQQPMCAAVCVAKCECPRSAPLLKDGRCLDESECYLRKSG